MIGIFDNPQVAFEVGGIFGTAAQDIRDRASSSLRAEEEGERGAREDSYTDEFIYQMRSKIAAGLNDIAGRLSNTGTKVEINFHSTNLPVSEENRYGADIGLRVIFRTYQATLIKGLLIQCKRMYPPASKPSYQELRGRGEKQAKDMLRITPASFFMLFNFGEQRELLNLSSIPVGTVCPQDGEFIRSSKRIRIGDNCPLWAESIGSIWDMGIAMLPASRVLAMSSRAAMQKSKLPVDAKTILRGCLPLGVFMADMVGSCFVGDVREEVVRIVTPPEQREQAFALMGLTRTDFDDFAVRHYIDLVVTGEGGAL